jgi:MFS family permease
VTDLSTGAARRNITLLSLDFITFGVGMAVLGPTTILPNLILLLGGSPVAVGVMGAVQMGGWLLPQLFVSRLVAGKPLVKRYVIVPLIASRICLALSVPAIAWLAAQWPDLALAALLLAFATFMFGDALAGVPWFELLGKAVPLERRGRVMGIAQSLSSLLALGAGVIVAAVLGRPGSALRNHLLLVSLAAVLFAANPLLLGQIQEPRGATDGEGQQPAWRDYLPHLATILRTDARFAWLIVVRWLSGLADMAAAFYVLFAADRLQVPAEMIGLFVSAGMAGTLLCGALLGPLGDHRGRIQVIRVVMLLRVLCPVLALLAPSLAGLHRLLAPGAFLLVYVAMGMANGAWLVGFMNYLLEVAPPGERTLYVGLANTLGGLLLGAPLLAGWLVKAFSYEVLFVLVLALASLGLLLALRGPQPATRQATL